MLDALIEILETNSAQEICSKDLDCSGIDCKKCPFSSEGRKQETIDKLTELSKTEQ